MAAVIYALCMLTALACTVLLLRGYKRSRSRVLLWSGLCFAGLTLNNLFLVLDRIVFPTEVDLFTVRLALGFVALMLLLYGLIWESD